MKKLYFLVLAVALIFAINAEAVDSWNTETEHIYTQRATGAAALASTLAPAVEFQLVEIRIHLSAASATSENFTITMDAGAGAVYDTVILTKDFDTVADYVYTFTGGENVARYFSKTDELDFAWANTNTRTYGLEIKYKKIR